MDGDFETTLKISWSAIEIENNSEIAEIMFKKDVEMTLQQWRVIIFLKLFASTLFQRQNKVI